MSKKKKQVLVRIERNWNHNIAGWNGTATVENSLAVPKKLNVKLPCHPAIPLLNIYSKELKIGMQTKLICKVYSIIYYGKSVERTQVSIKMCSIL